MKEEYNSRQRKIYHDYIGYSTENLFEMVKNSKKYLPGVIGIIEDILIERNVMHPRSEKPSIDTQEISERENAEKERLLKEEESKKKDETVKMFIKKHRERSDSEISGIVTRYISFEQEAVEAALIISVDRGLISYDLKELLLVQINSNFDSHRNNVKQRKWEKNNAFEGYFTKYSDEEIYNIIDDPNDIVMDVYHAVLLTAKHRQLISDDDFESYYNGAKAAVRTDTEIMKDEIDQFLGSDPDDDVFKSEAELEAEKEKFWKCPSCGKLVDMDLGVCWNCQTEMPATIVHPDTEEIIKEKVSERKFHPFKTGFTIIGAGLFVGLLGFEKSYFGHTHYGRFVIGGVFVIMGIAIIIIGILSKTERE